MTLVVVDEDDLICMDCDKPLPRGSVYSERVLSPDVTEIICLTCSTTGVTS